MKHTSILRMAEIGLMTALIAVISPFSVPVVFSPVPFSLAIFAVFLVGCLMGCKGVFAVFLYLFIGCIGLPVFQGFTGGIQCILGPTGGYLLGYIAVVLCMGWFSQKYERKVTYMMIGGVLGLMICYLFGSVWYAGLYHVSIKNAILLCVLPYVVFDLMKLCLAIMLGRRLYIILMKQNIIL